MSPPDDDTDDMRRDPDPDDRLAEELLRGRRAAVPEDDAPVIDALDAIRASTARRPRPSQELLRVFAEGVGTEEAPTTAPSTTTRSGGALARGGRRRLALGRRTARVAGLSLALKLGLGAAATAAIAGGAGVAGVLPGQSPVTEDADVEVGPADDPAHDGEAGTTGRADDLPPARGGAGPPDEVRVPGGNEADGGLDEGDGRPEGTAPATPPQSGEDGREHAEDRTDEAPAAPGPADRPATRAPADPGGEEAPDDLADDEGADDRSNAEDVEEADRPSRDAEGTEPERSGSGSRAEAERAH